MSDKGFGITLAALGMGACCIGLPLLVALISSGVLVAWLNDNALVAFLVVFGGIMAIVLIRRSNRRAREIENRTTSIKRG